MSFLFSREKTTTSSAQIQVPVLLFCWYLKKTGHNNELVVRKPTAENDIGRL